MASQKLFGNSSAAKFRADRPAGSQPKKSKKRAPRLRPVKILLSVLLVLEGFILRGSVFPNSVDCQIAEYVYRNRHVYDEPSVAGYGVHSPGHCGWGGGPAECGAGGSGRCSLHLGFRGQRRCPPPLRRRLRRRMRSLQSKRRSLTYTGRLIPIPCWTMCRSIRRLWPGAGIRFKSMRRAG